MILTFNLANLDEQHQLLCLANDNEQICRRRNNLYKNIVLPHYVSNASYK